MPKAHQTALACFALIWALTWLNQVWPLEKALHDSLTVVALIALYWADRRFRLPLSSWILVLAFLSLHEVAAQWLYSYVPYDHWTEELFGFRISHVFGWQRNHFDRLVHFAYGVCAAGVGYRFLLDRTRASRHRAALRAVEIVLATGALYELFEWGVASLLAPGMAEAYNGQQGDVWDPHKDITLAVVGAVLTVSFLLLRTRIRATRDQTGITRD